VAIRDSEISAQSMGIQLSYYKTLSFAISAALAGVGGALYAHNLRFLSPDQFNIIQSIDLLLMVVIGGLGSIHGVFLGSIFLITMPQLISALKDWLPAAVADAPGLKSAIYGGVLVLFVLFEPWACTAAGSRYAPSSSCFRSTPRACSSGRSRSRSRSPEMTKRFATGPASCGIVRRRWTPAGPTGGHGNERAIASRRQPDVRFGGVVAVNAVSFDVREGEVLTLIGPNGAGKTTVFNLISRIYAPTQAHRLPGPGHHGGAASPHRVAGIARTFQNIELFEHATVLHNLLIGRHRHAAPES